MTINWTEAEEKAGGNFKPYSADGKYTVKCNGVEIKEVGSNGSVIMRFGFEEDADMKYPTADHWLSFKNDNWRYIHNKRLMMLFGASEDAAKKGVELAEGKSDKDNIIKGYETVYKKLLAKKPEVEIEVYTSLNQSNGKEYARAEFTDKRVAMPHDNAGQSEAPAPTVIEDGPIEGAEEVSLEDFPF